MTNTSESEIHPNLPLAEEISSMLVLDQEMRRQYYETKEWNADIDKKNTAKAKEIIAQIGWPTISKVGEKASHEFWLLIQHSGDDLDFQKECLELMTAQPRQEVRQDDVGYLEDKIRIQEGHPTLYGSQFSSDSATGEYGPLPIEDREHLDERRFAMDMIPFAEYEKIMRERFGPKVTE